MAKQTKVVKKRKVKVEAIGEAHIQASFNNIIISLTNKNGEVISWATAGKMGFRGSKRILHSQLKWLQKIALLLLTKQV